MKKNRDKKKIFKKAFTLAEVLITLGIIGIVAALTMPSLIQNYQKQVTLTRLKKAYTDIYNAVKFSEIENGPVKEWDFKGYSIEEVNYIGEKYLKPYFKGIEVVDGANGYNAYKLSNGTILNLHADGTDGIMYSIFIIIDLNGDAKPNMDRFYITKTDRKNLFSFIISRNGFVGFYDTIGWNIANEDKREELLTNPSYGCNKDNEKAANCGALIQYDGWEIKDDYPW